MHYLIIATLALASAGAAQDLPAANQPNPEPEPVVLTGCVFKGLERDTYIITDIIRTDPGAALAPFEVIYWLNSAKKLKGHVGHRVEVQGEMKLRPADGTVAIDSDVVEIDSEGKRRARIEADAPGAADAINDGGPRPTYDVEVKEVRRIEEGCVMPPRPDGR